MIRTFVEKAFFLAIVDWPYTVLQISISKTVEMIHLPSYALPFMSPCPLTHFCTSFCLLLIVGDIMTPEMAMVKRRNDDFMMGTLCV